MKVTEAVLEVKDVATILGVTPATIRRYINGGTLSCAESKMGNPQNGYWFAGEKLVEELREKHGEAHARLVEQAIARMPSPN